MKIRFKKKKDKTTGTTKLKTRKNKDIANLKIGKNLLRRLNIQTRLIISFFILSILPLSVIGLYSYNKTSSAILSKTENSTRELIKMVAGNISSRLKNYDSINYAKIMDYEFMVELNRYTISHAADQRTIAATYLTPRLQKDYTLDRNVLAVILNVNDEYKFDTSPFGQAPYISAEEMRELREQALRSNTFRTWTYRKADDGKDIFIYTLATRSDSPLIMRSSSANYSDDRGNHEVTLFVVYNESFMSGIYKEISIGEGSDIFVIDSGGTVISSMNSSAIHINRPFPDETLITDILNSHQSGKTTFNKSIDGKEYLVTHSVIPDSDWYVVGMTPFSYLQSEPRVIGNAILYLAIVILAASIFISSFISFSISSPLEKLVSFMERSKYGDLTMSISDPNRDEISSVLNGFQEMISTIRNLILKVDEASQSVASKSDKINSLSMRTYISSENIAKTMQDIANGAMSQAEEVLASKKSAENLNETIENISYEINTVAGTVKHTKNLCASSLLTSKALNSKAILTRNATEKIITNIKSLDSEMHKIKDILNLIFNITQQTNLLSLNAEIEAARAGEFGRGFSVVAQEIKKLADKSKEASESINAIISDLIERTRNTAEEADKTGVVIHQQMQAVEETTQAFIKINEAMDGVSEQIAIMENSIAEIISSNRHVLESIKNIALVSEETASTVEEISANTEEQMYASEELDQYAKELNATVSELKSSISIFKTHTDQTGDSKSSG